MPEISIVIPAYNAAKTIAATIDSVRQQTFTDWELIVINDGSTDNTLAIVQEIAEPRLRIISVDNSGVASARNLGIAHAWGNYIAFLDADDLWVSDKLAKQLQALAEHPDAIAAYSWTCFMDEQQSGAVYHSSPEYQYFSDVYSQLLQADFIHSGSNILVWREALFQTGGFDAQCNGCEDWDMWLRLAAIGNFAVVPQHQIIYRRAFGSASSNIEQMYQKGQYAIEKAYKAAPTSLQYLRQVTDANLHLYIASLYLQHGVELSQTQQAGRHLRWSIRKRLSVLRQTWVQKLMLKFALRYLFPGQLGRNIFEKLRTAIAIKNPREIISKH